MRVADVERTFWRKVTFKPFFLGETKVGPLVYVSVNEPHDVHTFHALPLSYADGWSSHTFIPGPHFHTSPHFQVREKFAPITCIAPSTNGSYLAIGTATGATVIFDIRNDPANPWFEV